MHSPLTLFLDRGPSRNLRLPFVTKIIDIMASKVRREVQIAGHDEHKCRQVLDRNSMSSLRASKCFTNSGRDHESFW